VKFPTAVCAAVVALAVTAAVSLRAQQARTVKEGVYTDAQAARGKAIFDMRCALCHGERLEGAAGPPLAGEVFLGPWDSEPLAAVFDKINATMPADTPGTLAPQQVVDLVAFILQANRFPDGKTELAPAAAPLEQIAIVASIPRAAVTNASPTAAFPATGTLNQVMRGILFPSSNVLFDVQTRDPSAGSKGGVARADATTTSTRYGDVYSPWQVVDAAAISIAEIGPVLMQPRRCENGEPAPIDRADWKQYVQGVVEAGRAAYRASQMRSQDAVSEATNVISDACANCHRVYRDVASAAMRCTPP